MFRAWTFTEMPYPYLPPEYDYESLRVSLPSAVYDPEVGYELYKRYLDIYVAADRLGLDIMLNEHHATATSVTPAVPLALAALARETKSARLLALGNPIANRNTPVRVAEEMAFIDVLSQGRLEVGFVRGVPYEIAAGNVDPLDTTGRLWEGAELITKAWTTTSGPFNWEGSNYHHRQVNVWPRVYQEPHPPVWIPTQSSQTVREVAERQFKLATILCGHAGARKMFDTYREHSSSIGVGYTPRERLGYVGLVFVGETDADGEAGARKLLWYLKHNKVAPQFANVPGYMPSGVRSKLLEDQFHERPLASPVDHLANAPLAELIDGGYLFAGSSETVFDQLRNFYDKVGGFGNFIMMVQSGTMGFDLVENSMKLFADKVLNRFRTEVYSKGNQ